MIVLRDSRNEYDADTMDYSTRNENNLNFTRTALLSAFELGFSRFEIVEVIQTMEKEHFYKSMTSHANHKIWQEQPKVESFTATAAGTLGGITNTTRESIILCEAAKFNWVTKWRIL